MQQQTPVYPTMMNNQGQNVYNPAANNPALNRTPSQTPMSIQNQQQWTNNSTMNVNRPPNNAYNQVKRFVRSWTFLLHHHVHLDDGTWCSTTTTLCRSTATALSIEMFDDCFLFFVCSLLFCSILSLSVTFYSSNLFIIITDLQSFRCPGQCVWWVTSILLVSSLSLSVCLSISFSLSLTLFSPFSWVHFEKEKPKEKPPRQTHTHVSTSQDIHTEKNISFYMFCTYEALFIVFINTKRKPEELSSNTDN